jgi:iron only hydrogenase large subunit-like protein
MLLKKFENFTCSGCVTSAETVMLEKQSLDEFLSHFRNSEEKVIVSVSPQSRASLAAFFDLSPTQVCCSTIVVY